MQTEQKVWTGSWCKTLTGSCSLSALTVAGSLGLRVEFIKLMVLCYVLCLTYRESSTRPGHTNHDGPTSFSPETTSADTKLLRRSPKDVCSNVLSLRTISLIYIISGGGWGGAQNG